MSATATAQDMVRVGLLTAHLTRQGGGVYTSVRRFATMLGEEPGLQVEVFGPQWPGDDFAEWDGVNMHASRAVGPGAIAYAPGLLPGLKKSSLDLIHLHGLWMHPSAACAAFTRQTGRPHIISPHGMLEQWALNNSRWKKQLAARLFEDANIKSALCLHALNIAEVNSIREYGYEGPVCVIPNGVDMPRGDQTPPAPWWAKSAPEVKTLLYLGRLHRKKGLGNLLRAWSDLGEEREQWRLVIAGWDEHGYRNDLQSLSMTLRIQSTVSFPGPLFGEEKDAAYRYCDGFILPSMSEGLPMVLLEAWAWGKPVLMTPQCNLPEGFEAGAAVRIEPERESIVEGLREFMAMDDARREAIGENGRLLAERRFSWPVIAGEMAKVYRWAAGSGPEPVSIVHS